MWKPGARRTPFPREAPLVSLVRETAGSSGVQTSAKRQAREMCTHRASFFPHPRLPPFSHSPSLFILSLCCVSAATPLFYQINISQNKSQDNFKLAREEKRHGGEEGGRNWVQFSRLLWSGVSVFPLTSFWGLWFFSSASRSQCNWWGRHNCFWMPKEGRCRASRLIFTYSYHKQKSSATWQKKSTDAFSDHCAILRTRAQRGDMRPAAALASALPPLLEAVSHLMVRHESVALSCEMFTTANTSRTVESLPIAS